MSDQDEPESSFAKTVRVTSVAISVLTLAVMAYWAARPAPLRVTLPYLGMRGFQSAARGLGRAGLHCEQAYHHAVDRS